MYGYIRTDELKELIIKNRHALIIYNVVTKDMDEYINSCLALLQSNGFNIGFITQPKIKHLKDDSYIILILFRQGVIYEEHDIKAINKFIADMGNVSLLVDYYRKMWHKLV